MRSPSLSWATYAVVHYDRKELTPAADTAGRSISGRALEDGATHPRRGRWRAGEQTEDLCRVGQLTAAGGADVDVPAHAPQTRLVQLAKDEVRQLSDDRQVIP